ncbi:ApbE family [Romboutsia lituseburensis]|uniref:FAD:protein FMN transferase n=1 Tax=Romboutsia lituseburensis TaxID=1537 RepID=UPI000E15D1E3|nr:FAD:protein FMN transferase [Romboutsia lituseburensis]CEH33702.1 ApbE family [Romboutsia lituseburensis]
MLDIMERKDFIFNTNVEQKIYTSKLSDSLVLDKATNMMIDLEKRLNFYDSSSEISQINKYAGHKFVKVSFETFELIKQSIKFSQKNGWTI